MGIPETEYDYEATVTTASPEFARIVRDSSNLGEPVKTEVSKEGIRFMSKGDAANESVLLKNAERQLAFQWRRGRVNESHLSELWLSL